MFFNGSKSTHFVGPNRKSINLAEVTPGTTYLGRKYGSADLGEFWATKTGISPEKNRQKSGFFVGKEAKFA